MVDFSQVTDILLGNTPVEQVSDSRGNVLWSAAPVVLPSYFYVEDASGTDNTLSITKSDFSAPDVEVFYSTDQQNWSSIGTTSDTPITATIPANGKLYLKATADTWGDGGMFAYNYINASGAYNVGGNIMSLLYGDNYTNQTSFPTGSAYNFIGLFSDMNTSHLISAQDLILPATTLAESCYNSMFSGCASLTAAPTLPATTLAESCYSYMFNGCTSLTATPALPATTLAPHCYSGMFSGCASLTAAPTLPATTLAESCYSSMFSDCTSLTATPALPITTLTDNCYQFMFNGCTSLTTAPELPAITLANGCYQGMFQGCTSLTTAPELPAITLANGCYQGMFQGCTSLTATPALPATTLASSCYSSMFSGCTSLTTAPALPVTTLANYCYQGMFQGCTSLTATPALPATTLASSCYSSMFSGCTSLTTAPALPVTTLANYCYSGMFNGCTSLTATPALPATTLADGCYSGMFQGCTSLTTAPSTLPATTLYFYCYGQMFAGCTSLTTAPALPATTLAKQCYQSMFWNCTSLNSVTTYANNISATKCLSNWLQNVAAIGDFYNLGAATYPSGASGIPEGWTEHKWYNVTVTAGNNGSVRVNGVIGNYSQRVQSGTVLTIEGIPNNGYLFSTWSDGNTANPRTVTVNSNLYLSSTFTTVPNYMYVEDVSGTANTLKIAKDNNSAPAINLYYSADAVNWTRMGNPSTTGFTTTIPANGRVYLKATADRWGNGGQRNYITANNNYNVGGNIMSLLYGDNFEGQTTLPSGANYHFDSLFRNDAHLVSAEDLSMPATTLATYCYQEMFKGCTALTTAPALPAPTLTESCYQAMFQGCTSLNNVRVSANDISALQCTTNWLANVAATGDFYNNGTATYTVDSGSGIPTGWTEHKGTPDEYFWIENPNDIENTVDIRREGSAHAINLYYSTDKVNWQRSDGWVDIEPQSKVYMKANTDKWANGIANYYHFDLYDEFNVGGNIMSLLYGDNYKDVTTFGTNNTYAFTGLFYGSKVVDASQLKLPTNTVNSCYEGMFSGCTALTTAPALPATTLAPSCYRNMFFGCTLLNKIVSYAEDATVSALKTRNWLNGVSANGDFYNLGNAGYTSGPSGIPTGWTEHNSL